MGDVFIPLIATEGHSKQEVIDKIKKACKRLPLPVPYADRKRAKEYARDHFGINTMPLEKPREQAQEHKEES